MTKNAFLLLGMLITFCFACDPEEIEGPDLSPTVFSSTELQVLNQVLNLNAHPFNYANMALPPHYAAGEADDSDNTPEYNAITDMGATLGRVLFYDRNLSIDNSISCASCHQQGCRFFRQCHI